MTDPSRRVVAAFDFDGTLTRRDTLVPFLYYFCGPRAVTSTLARHSFRLGLAMGLDRSEQRSSVKEAVLRDLLAGRRHDEVWSAGERFAERLGRAGMRPQTVSRWRWHRQQGHDIVVISASLEAYIHPFAHAMGGADVLGTRLRADDSGALTGEFDGFNCRGAEKVRRLREWGLCSNVELWAYGNSSGDRDLLAAAQVPHRVGRGTRCPTPPVQWRQPS